MLSRSRICERSESSRVAMDKSVSQGPLRRGASSSVLLVSAVLTLAMTLPVSAQDDDLSDRGADGKAKTSAPKPPGIFRGGLVQQLRSITGNVLGAKEKEPKKTDAASDADSEFEEAVEPSEEIDGEGDVVESDEGDSPYRIPTPTAPAPKRVAATPPPAPARSQPRVQPERTGTGVRRWANAPTGPISDPPSLSQMDGTPSGVPTAPPQAKVAQRRSSASSDYSNDSDEGQEIPLPSDTAPVVPGDRYRGVGRNGPKIPTPPPSVPERKSTKESVGRSNSVGGGTANVTKPAPTGSETAASEPESSESKVKQPSTQKSSRRAGGSVSSAKTPVGGISERMSDAGSTASEKKPELDAKESKDNLVSLPKSTPSSSSGEFPQVAKKPLPGKLAASTTPSTETKSEGPATPPASKEAETKPAAEGNLALPSPPKSADLTLDKTSTSNLPPLPGSTAALPNSGIVAPKASPAPVGKEASSRGKGPEQKTLLMQIPSVQVRLTGPGDMPVGKPAAYRVIAENTGSTDLNGLIVRLNVPPGMKPTIEPNAPGESQLEPAEGGWQSVIWQVTEIKPGQSQQLPLSFVAAEARNFAIPIEWTVLPQSGEMGVGVQQAQLQIALEGPSEVQYGQPHLYRLKLSNPGTAAAEDVVLSLTAEPYGANTSPIGTIPPGSQRTVEVELTFQQKGNLKIRAEAKGAGELKAESGIDIIVRQAALKAELTGPEVEYFGSQSDYEAVVTNDGDTTSANVNAEIQLPAGATLVTIPEGARQDGRKLIWTINSIAPSQSVKLPFALSFAEPGEQLVAMTVRGSAGGVASADRKTKIDAIADLKLTVSDPVAPAPVGKDVTYELKIHNRGASAAKNVRVIAQFSEGIEPTAAEGVTGQIVPGQVLFQPIAAIEAGGEVKLLVRAQASEAGIHRFRVEVQTEENDIRLVEEESTQFLQTAVKPKDTTIR